MQTVITVNLDSTAHPYRLNEDAYQALGRYLDHARARLAPDLDQAEVISDLEGSIGARLTDRLGSADRIVTIDDVRVALDAVGPVGAGDEQARPVVGHRTRRRLYRISAGKSIAGVCTGLAAYSEIRLDWVRSVFVGLTLVSAGLFAFVYLVLAFVLPVVATREAWIAALDQDARG